MNAEHARREARDAQEKFAEKVTWVVNDAIRKAAQRGLMGVFVSRAELWGNPISDLLMEQLKNGGFDVIKSDSSNEGYTIIWAAGFAPSPPGEKP